MLERVRYMQHVAEINKKQPNVFEFYFLCVLNMTFTRTSPWWLKCAIIAYIEARYLMGVQQSVDADIDNTLTTFHACSAMCAVWWFTPSLLSTVRSRTQTTKFVCHALMFLSCVCVLIHLHSRVFHDYSHLICCVQFCWVHFLFCAWQKIVSNPYILTGGPFLRVILPFSIALVGFHLSSITTKIVIFDLSFLCMVFAGEIVGNVSFLADQLITHSIEMVALFIS